MERLTRRRADAGEPCICTIEALNKSVERLAAYEDTGLEPEEVERHGRWINKQGGFWEIATCDQCGGRYPTVGITPNFCPNCGAKMDGGGGDA